MSVLDVLRRPGRLLFVGGRRASTEDLTRWDDAIRLAEPTSNLAWVDGAGRVAGLAVRWADAADLPAGIAASGTVLAGRLEIAPGLTLEPRPGSSIELAERPPPAPDSERDPADDDQTSEGDAPPHVEPGSDPAHFLIGPPALRFLGSATLSGSGATVRLDAGIELALLGPGAGMLRCRGRLEAGATAEITHPFDGRTVSATAFDLPEGAVAVALDPAAPFDPERTSIRLGPDVHLSTGWSDPTGRAVHLRTVDGSAVTPQPTGSSDVVLAPTGPYESVGGADMVCGRSGAEFLRLDVGGRVVLRPGQSPDGTSRDLDQGPATSWVSAAVGQTIPYFTQSGSDPIHRPYGGFLVPVDVSVGALTADRPIPTMPWLGMGESGPSIDDAMAVEARLRSIRFERLSSPPGTPEVDRPVETIPAVTANGLRVQLDGPRPVSLDLLHVQGQILRLDVADNAALQSGLVADRPFLVLTEPPQVVAGEEPMPTTITVGGWPLSLSPEQWARRRTAMVVKQRTDRSLARLLADPTSWTNAEMFDDVARTAAGLQAWVETTRTEEDEAKVALTARVLDDPAWQGVLFTSVPAELSSLPDDLAAVRAGLPDGEPVLAHHLVVDRRSLVDDRADSAVSGLIEYPTPGRAAARGLRADGFGFATRSLRVRLADTEVVEFGAEVEVTIPSFLGMTFAEPIEVVLNGRQVERAGRPGYSFRTLLDRPLRAEVRDAVVAAVELTAADLSTATGVQAMFDGAMAFTGPDRGDDATPHLDLVGYDTLTFAGLALSIPIVTVTDRAPDSRRFTWSTEEVSLTGDPVDGSLPARFPLTPTGLLHGAADDRAGLGHLPVRLPTDWPTPPSGRGFVGIEHRLDLGSVGSLADDSPLAAHVAVSWAPASPDRSPDLGFGFPGFDIGAHGFSLQDVLSLTAHGIELAHSDGPDGDAWGLVLRGIALELLALKIPWAGSIDAFLTPGLVDGRPVMGWSARYPGPDTE